MIDLKQEYEKLSKKYNLPKYEELDDQFELLYFHQIIEIKYPLRFVRRRMFDKINSFIVFLQNLVNPNPASLISLEESKFFSDEEKNEIISLIREMIKLERQSVLIDLSSTEEKEAKFIKEVYSFWKKHKEKIYKINQKIKENWEKETTSDEKETLYG